MSLRSSSSRREFLKSSAGAAALAVTAASYSRAIGANDRISLAQIGCGNRGFGAHMTGVQKLKLIRDMVVISFADGSIDNAELACLVWLCQNLGVDPQFIQQVISSATRGVD